MIRRLGLIAIAVSITVPPLAAQKAAPDAATLAAAKSVIAASGGRVEALKAMNGMKGAYLAQIRGQSPEFQKKVEAVLSQYMDEKNPLIVAYLDQIEATAIDFYASRFTVEELNTIGTFQSSPAGVKFRSVVPELMAVMSAPMIKFQQGLAEVLQREIKEP